MAKYGIEKYEDVGASDMSALDRALNLVCGQADDLNNMRESVQKELHNVSRRKEELEEAENIIMGALIATEDLRMKANERNAGKAMTAEGSARRGRT